MDNCIKTWNTGCNRDEIAVLDVNVIIVACANL